MEDKISIVENTNKDATSDAPKMSSSPPPPLLHPTPSPPSSRPHTPTQSSSTRPPSPTTSRLHKSIGDGTTTDLYGVSQQAAVNLVGRQSSDLLSKMLHHTTELKDTAAATDAGSAQTRSEVVSASTDSNVATVEDVVPDDRKKDAILNSAKESTNPPSALPETPTVHAKANGDAVNPKNAVSPPITDTKSSFAPRVASGGTQTSHFASAMKPKNSIATTSPVVMKTTTMPVPASSASSMQVKSAAQPYGSTAGRLAGVIPTPLPGDARKATPVVPPPSLTIKTPTSPQTSGERTPPTPMVKDTTSSAKTTSATTYVSSASVQSTTRPFTSSDVTTTPHIITKSTDAAQDNDVKSFKEESIPAPWSKKVSEVEPLGTKFTPFSQPFAVDIHKEIFETTVSTDESAKTTTAAPVVDDIGEFTSSWWNTIYGTELEIELGNQDRLDQIVAEEVNADVYCSQLADQLSKLVHDGLILSKQAPKYTEQDCYGSAETINFNNLLRQSLAEVQQMKDTLDKAKTRLDEILRSKYIIYYSKLAAVQHSFRALCHRRRNMTAFNDIHSSEMKIQLGLLHFDENFKHVRVCAEFVEQQEKDPYEVLPKVVLDVIAELVYLQKLQQQQQQVSQELSTNATTKGHEIQPSTSSNTLTVPNLQ